MTISPCSGSAWRGVPGLRGLGRLDLAKEDGELFRGNLVAAQKRFERVHQQHLNADEFGEDVHFHPGLAGPFKAMQEHIAYPVSEGRSLRPGETLKGHILAVRETRREDAIPGKRSLGAVGCGFE